MAGTAQLNIRLDSDLMDGRASIASFVQQRQDEFEQETGLDPSTYIPLDDKRLGDLVYKDWLEENHSQDAV